MKRATAMVLATIVVLSTIALPLGAAATTSAQTAGPSGMVALGSDQVSEDLPDNTDAKLRASDLEGAVYASDHADTLEVVVTTPDRAAGYLDEDGSNVIAEDDEVAIVLRDDEVHDGREVAVEIGVFEESIGYVPSVAYGTHESGEEWTSAITREDTVASFDVPRFSDNAVSFTGAISLSGDAAADGTNYEYELDSLDGVSDYSINLTGVENTAWDNESGTVSGSGSAGITPGGNLDPVGPGANGEPVLSLTGLGGTVRSYGHDPGSSTAFIAYGTLSGDKLSSELKFDDPPSSMDSITIEHGGATYDVSVDVYIVSGEGPDQNFQEGTLVKSGWNPNSGGGEETINFDDSGQISVNGPATVELVTTTISPDYDNDYSDVKTSDLGDSSLKGYYDAFGSGDTTDAPHLSAERNPPSSVDASIGGQTYQFGDFTDSETKTKEVNISTDDSSVDFTMDNGEIDWQLDIKERTETRDPVVELITDAGTQTISYSGTLADGETVDLSDQVDPSLIGGSVTANITVSDGVTSPVGQVGIEFNHDGFDSGGLIKYRVADVDGNAVTLEEDEIVDVAFTSSDVTVEPILQDGFAAVELYDYAAYFNDGS